ncbi:MAG: hypothetical protein P8X47_11445 [Ignavibacteriaceae bacterium]
MAELSTRLDEIRKQLGSFEAELKSKRFEINKVTENIYSLRSNISVAKERHKSVTANIAKYESEIKQYTERLKSTQTVIEQAVQNISKITSEIDSSRDLKDEFKSKIENANKLLEEKRTDVKKLSEQILAGLKQISDKENELANVTKSLDENSVQINKLNLRIQNLTNDVAKTVGFIENLKEEKEEVASSLNEAEDNYAKKVQEKEKLTKELSELKTRELELKSLINSLEDKVSFIQNIVDNYEGVSQGTKSLLEFSGWVKGDFALLANVGNTSDDYRPAIEAALRNNVNDILISNLEDLKNGIDHLKNNDLGRASFYLKHSSNQNYGLLAKIQKFLLFRQKRKIETNPSFKSWASSVVKADESWNSVFVSILEKTAIVTELDQAISLSQKFPDFRFVTLDGDLAEGKGMIEGGSVRADESLFGKRQLLDEIKRDIPPKQQELEMLSEKISELEKTISEIDLKVLSDQGRMLVNDLAIIVKQISQF